MKITLAKFTRELLKADNVFIRTGDDGRQRLVFKMDGKLCEVSDPIPTEEEYASTVAALERDHQGDDA